MTPPLDGVVAVVTGGAGHLGAAMTATMARQGARVVVADIDGEKAASHAGALADEGLHALGLTMDVTSDESVDAAFAEIVAMAQRKRLVERLTSMDGLDLDDPKVMARAWRRD